MFACIINALLFLGLLCSYYKRHKQVNFVFVVLALYALVAICGIGYFHEMYNIPRPVTVLPFIYFFFASYCLFYPLIKEGHKLNILKIGLPSGFNLLIFLYVVSSFLSLWSIWTGVVANIISGDWQSVKADAYSGIVEGFGPIVSYLAAFSQYLRYLIYPYCFYCFTRQDKNFFITVFILGLSVITSLFQYLLIAYRGGIFSILIMLFISFLIFLPNIQRKRKRKLYILGGVVGILLLLITMSITNSRFESSTQSSPLESLYSYFGQSMVKFNGGIANSATSYMGGKYFFMSAWGLDKEDFWVDSKYSTFTNDGQDFDTLVGCFYLDFGPVLAFIIFILVSWIVCKLLKKSFNSWTTLYILMFYLDLLVTGVFHGPSYLSQTVTNIIILYLVILMIEKYGYKNFSVLS